MNKVLLEITVSDKVCEKGHPVLLDENYSANPSEEEVLFPMTSCFKFEHLINK